MLTRISRGSVPRKPHTALSGPDGALRYEHCLTRDGFDGPYSILYHEHRPQAFTLEPYGRRWCSAKPAAGTEGEPATRRHFALPKQLPKGDSLDARLPLLFNDDVVLSHSTPTLSDALPFSNADSDELVYVQRGHGKLLSWFGELRFEPHDYLFIPKAVPRRFQFDGEQHWFSMEFRGALRIPSAFRNASGQLRMDAPYSFRDFRLPEFLGVIDEGVRDVVVKRNDALFIASYEHTPFDVVGYDGAIYPFAFSIDDFQARVGSVHLPPTAHATFESDGALVCSFVPRPLDFGKDAIPCPYPHSSSDIDEVLFYAEGSFGSRTGVASGSVTLHPRGVPHGPQPGRYEASLGQSHTDELAVMLDCKRPLYVAEDASAMLDPDYEASFR